MIKIGTRNSPLAIAQTQQLIADIAQTMDFPCSLVTMTTKGDRNIKDRFEKIGDKGLFTKELDDALLEKKVDLAVHSLKDLPSTLPSGLALGGVSICEHPHDAWVSDEFAHFDDVPQGATVGTASVRRTALLRARRPDLIIVPVRGNVQTRLKKMRDEKMAGILLAASGLIRMNLADEIRHTLDSQWCTPAPGQGYLAITIRENDPTMRQKLMQWQNPQAWKETEVIRGIMQRVQGGCSVPLGITCRINDDQAHIVVRCLSVDGHHNIETSYACTLNDLDHAPDHVYSLMSKNGATQILKGKYDSHKN